MCEFTFEVISKLFSDLQVKEVYGRTKKRTWISFCDEISCHVTSCKVFGVLDMLFALLAASLATHKKRTLISLCDEISCCVTSYKVLGVLHMLFALSSASLAIQKAYIDHFFSRTRPRMAYNFYGRKDKDAHAAQQLTTLEGRIQLAHNRKQKGYFSLMTIGVLKVPPKRAPRNSLVHCHYSSSLHKACTLETIEGDSPSKTTVFWCLLSYDCLVIHGLPRRWRLHGPPSKMSHPLYLMYQAS